MLVLLWTIEPVIPVSSASGQESSGRIHHVSAQTGDLAEILDQAEDGDTLILKEGVHQLEETVMVTKQVTIRGNGDAVVAGKIYPLLQLEGKGVVVRGLTFRYEGTASGIENSLLLLRGSQFLIEDNRFENQSVSGIKLVRTDHSRIENNVFTGRPEWSKSMRGNGVYLQESHDNMLIHNSVIAVQDGFYVYDSHRNQFQANQVQDSRYAIHLMYSGEAVIAHNRTINNVTGAMIMGSSGGEVKENLFSLNTSYNGCGILLYDAQKFDIHHNEIRQNGMGVYLEEAYNNSIYLNQIRYNHRAWVTKAANSGNRIYENNMSGNVDPLTVQGKELGEPFADQTFNNYWDEHHGFDLDGDGFSDDPYRRQNILAFYTSRSPALQWFFDSPVMMILQYSTPDNMAVDEKPALHPAYAGTERNETDLSATNSGSFLWMGTGLILISIILILGGFRHEKNE